MHTHPPPFHQYGAAARDGCRCLLFLGSPIASGDQNHRDPLDAGNACDRAGQPLGSVARACRTCVVQQRQGHDDPCPAIHTQRSRRQPRRWASSARSHGCLCQTGVGQHLWVCRTGRSAGHRRLRRARGKSSAGLHACRYAETGLTPFQPALPKRGGPNGAGHRHRRQRRSTSPHGIHAKVTGGGATNVVIFTPGSIREAPRIFDTQ